MFHICTCLVYLICSLLWRLTLLRSGLGGPLTAFFFFFSWWEGRCTHVYTSGGAAEPFWVWTDHKDLKYIRSAKRLSSLQARWALFFDRFCFPLSYRPGSKNIKPDALSRLFASPGREAPPDTISPRSVVVASVSWGVERRVREALWGVEVLRGCPTGLLFVPGLLLPSVLEWSHSSRLVCHPGVQRTLASVLYSSWLLALFASRTRLLTSLPLVCCSLCQSPPTLGPILPWTLLQYCDVDGCGPLFEGSSLYFPT